MANVAMLRFQGVAFSIFLAHYDGGRQNWLDLAGEVWYKENVDAWSSLQGYKFQILQKLLKGRDLDVRPFRWIWAVDEDMDIVQADVPAILQLAEESGALLVSPAYKSNWHTLMQPKPACKYRFVNFLEVSFPLIRPEALVPLLDAEVCHQCLHESSVWGLDALWCSWSARHLGRDRMQACAVVDAAPVLHRNFQTLAGKYLGGKGNTKHYDAGFHEQAMADRHDVLVHHAEDFALKEMEHGCLLASKREASQEPREPVKQQGRAVPAAGRWAVCIVGQLSRLEVESKLQNLFRELANQGAEVDAYFVLELRSNFYSNADTDYGRFGNCSKDAMRLHMLKKTFQPWYKVGRYLRHNASIHKELNMSRWGNYQVRFLDRLQKLANDITQLRHIAACEGLIRKYEGKRAYTDVLRIRDNAVVTRPFPSELVRFPGIAVKDSQSWWGLNDKAMYASRQFLTPALTAALQLAMQINEGTVPQHLYNRSSAVKNSEMLLAAALQDYPVSQLPSFKMVLVDGRCYGLRRFCLVPPWKDTPPEGPDLWARPCNETLNVSGLPSKPPRRPKIASRSKSALQGHQTVPNATLNFTQCRHVILFTADRHGSTWFLDSIERCRYSQSPKKRPGQAFAADVFYQTEPWKHSGLLRNLSAQKVAQYVVANASVKVFPSTWHRNRSIVTELARAAVLLDVPIVVLRRDLRATFRSLHRLVWNVHADGKESPSDGEGAFRQYEKRTKAYFQSLEALFQEVGARRVDRLHYEELQERKDFFLESARCFVRNCNYS